MKWNPALHSALDALSGARGGLGKIEAVRKKKDEDRAGVRPERKTTA